MDINGKMTLIENMAKAELPMVGFSNFVLEKGNIINADSIGEQYLRIIKEYDCCGAGNRPHYLKVEVPVPGGSETIVTGRFFDSLSGSQFYANRFYGIINFDLSGFDEWVDQGTLKVMREYLISNRENLRFIITNAPSKSIEDITKWDSFDICVLNDNKPNVHEYINEYFLEKNIEHLPDNQEAIENMIAKFPTNAWDRAIEFLLNQDSDLIEDALPDNREETDYNERRIGFTV